MVLSKAFRCAKDDNNWSSRCGLVFGGDQLGGENIVCCIILWVSHLFEPSKLYLNDIFQGFRRAQDNDNLPLCCGLGSGSDWEAGRRQYSLLHYSVSFAPFCIIYIWMTFLKTFRHAQDDNNQPSSCGLVSESDQLKRGNIIHCITLWVLHCFVSSNLHLNDIFQGF
jgi:hypothetical protein